MGERTDQIERHIHQTRNELGDNIHELQQKVKTTLDWRAQFRQRPMTLLGAAFGGGLLLALTVPGNRRSTPRSYSQGSWPEQTTSRQDRSLEYIDRRSREFATKTANVWDSLRAALLTTGVNRLTAFVEEVLPGFQEQFRQKQNEKGQAWRPNGPENTERRATWRSPGGETDFGHNA